MQTPSLKKKNTGVLQLWKKMVRWKADLCPSVSCGLTMGDVYWYWLSTGDRDEVDTDSEIRRDVFIKRKKKSSLCVHICVCRGGGTNLSHLNSKISQRERRTKTEEESLQTKSGLLTAHGNKHQGLQFNSSCGTAKVSYCSSTTVLCGGGIAKWVNSRAYEKSPRRLCPLNPLYYSPLSSSLVKLLLLQIVMGIDFFYWSGLSSACQMSLCSLLAVYRQRMRWMLIDFLQRIQPSFWPQVFWCADWKLSRKRTFCSIKINHYSIKTLLKNKTNQTNEELVNI